MSCSNSCSDSVAKKNGFYGLVEVLSGDVLTQDVSVHWPLTQANAHKPNLPAQGAEATEYSLLWDTRGSYDSESLACPWYIEPNQFQVLLAFWTQLSP